MPVVNLLDKANVLSTGDVMIKAMGASMLVQIPFSVAGELIMLVGPAIAGRSIVVEGAYRLMTFSGALGSLVVMAIALDAGLRDKM
jgi:ABC-type iron transport system FetAB ATPase subunit